MDSGLEQSGTSTPRRGKRLTCTDGFNNLMVSLRGTFDKLNQLWDEVEMEDWQRRQRMETAFKHTDDLLQEMIEAETTMVVSVKENIEHGLKEIDKLREQLEHEAWIRPRYAPNSLLMLKAIKSEVTSLKQEYEVRLEDQLATIKVNLPNGGQGFAQMGNLTLINVDPVANGNLVHEFRSHGYQLQNE